MTTDNPRNTLALSDTVDALSQAMAVWDADSFQHGERTADYARAIALELGVSAEMADEIRVGALLHDIGKMGLDLAVLKKEGKLEEHETAHVQAHPEMGASILGRVLPDAIVECAAAHHEQPDGRGYPHGLVEDQISLAALICRVADVFDALTSPQTYRGAMSVEEALAELHDGAGTRYSARIVRALTDLVERQELKLAA